MPTFSEVMDQAVLSDSSLSLNIGDDWLQGRTVYGGMQAAIAVKAMRLLADPAAPLRSLQVTFVGPVGGGEVSAQATLLRQGKSTGHVQATIIQEGTLRLIAVGIFAVDRQSQAFHAPAMPAIPVSLEDASAIPFAPGKRPPFLQHFESRIAEGAPLYSGAKTLVARMYAKHIDQGPCSDEHLAALADLPPPVAAMQLTEPAPGSSMNWQLDFIRTPAQLADNQWYRMDADVAAAGNGYSYQNCSIWTEDGQLAMLSRQCMAVFG
ncbi:thioesterase family protein [Proteobacteria bacterium 005FR1]|nr:thioesterase family protein [Proteobacteria bacterium 005FR1]